ncbi:MAG: hypothetical protein K6G00_00090 [Treponema sp.]|nr:hypothetical protein [Treponema sp.]
MKKLARLNFILLLLALTVTGAFAAGKYSSSIPKMDKEGMTYFTRDDFDDRYKDNVRFVSRTDDRVVFEFYAYNEKTDVWLLVGSADLKFSGDTCFVDEEVSKFKLSKYNYFALRPLNKKKYSYSYSVRHNDIYITVRDKED